MFRKSGVESNIDHICFLYIVTIMCMYINSLLLLLKQVEVFPYKISTHRLKPNQYFTGYIIDDIQISEDIE